MFTDKINEAIDKVKGVAADLAGKIPGDKKAEVEETVEKVANQAKEAAADVVKNVEGAVENAKNALGKKD